MTESPIEADLKGVEVMRFSGKQIKRDPFKCAHQVLSAATLTDTRAGSAEWMAETTLRVHEGIVTSLTRRMTGERE